MLKVSPEWDDRIALGEHDWVGPIHRVGRRRGEGRYRPVRARCLTRLIGYRYQRRGRGVHDVDRELLGAGIARRIGRGRRDRVGSDAEGVARLNSRVALGEHDRVGPVDRVGRCRHEQCRHRAILAGGLVGLIGDRCERRRGRAQHIDGELLRTGVARRIDCARVDGVGADAEDVAWSGRLSPPRKTPLGSVPLQRIGWRSL